MKRSLLATIILLASSTLSAATTFAEDTEDTVIAKVIEGYGGAKFENMESVTITSDLRFGWLGQGYTPDFVDLRRMIKIYDLDLKNMRGSEEAWGDLGSYSERVFTTDEGQYTIDYLNGVYTLDPEAGYYDHFGGEIRTVDTLLAYELVKNRDTAKLKGIRPYDGRKHYLIEFDMAGTSIEPEIWVDAETGHIRQVVRDIPDVYKINYVFDEYESAQGITYANNFELYIGGEMIEYMKSRSLKVNRVKSGTWNVERGYSEAESIDASEMSVTEVASGTFHVGQGGAFSTFIDAGDHLIVIGGYGGLKGRYDAFVEAHGTKPVKSVILTHFHLDHVEGAQEALDLGAELIMPETARANVETVVDGSLPADKIQIIIGDKTAVGPVDIYLISTSHAAEYALTYVPGTKTLFQGDHHNDNYSELSGSVNRHGASLKSEVDRLGLDVDFITSTHSPKIVNWSDFETKAGEFKPGLCPTGRKICRDLK